MKKLLIMSLLAIGLFPASAQLNLKNKLERKADQVVDDLLFGKKKKDKDSGSSSSSSTTPGEASETYKSDNDNAPNGGYVRKPVDYGSMNTGETVHFRQLIDFLPDNVGPFSLSDKPDGASMRFGEASYSSASKKYSNGDQDMSISIFDYLFTGALFGAYANAYKYESTEGMMKSIEVEGQPGWFSTTYESGSTQLTLVINNRFMLSISLEGASEDQLKEYVGTMEINKLPEGQVPEEEDPDDTEDNTNK
ncbi:MAG: hypothetical protein ACFHWX_00990 [Bacteroidota bacterium]